MQRLAPPSAPASLDAPGAAHWVSPAPQLTPQVPAEQTWPPGHTVPQAPQLVASVSVFTQLSLQATVPAPQ